MVPERGLTERGLRVRAGRAYNNLRRRDGLIRDPASALFLVAAVFRRGDLVVEVSPETRVVDFIDFAGGGGSSLGRSVVVLVDR